CDGNEVELKVPMARKILSLQGLGIVVLALSALVSLLLLSIRRSGIADTPGDPPSFDLSHITISPPVSGGSCYVDGPNALAGDKTQMQVKGRSVTRDNSMNNGVPQWYTLTYIPNAPPAFGTFHGYVQAAYGDLIEVTATNNYGGQSHTDTKQVGYVPPATDTAPPEFNPSNMTVYYSGTLNVTLNNYWAVSDPSYPIGVALYQRDNVGNKTTRTINQPPGTSFPVTLQI